MSLIFLFLFTFDIAIAQSKHWANNTFDQKVFIKNQGQFVEKDNDGQGKILFGASQQGINMYWSAKGLTYKVTEHYLSEKVKAEIKKGGDPEAAMKNMQVRYHYLSMEWVGSNPNAEIISEEPVSFYYTYGSATDKSGKSNVQASAYKKIIYKNIYPNIDAEFILPEKGGVKYSMILHPGADPGVIKMREAGASKVNLNSKNELEINSLQCGSYLEHNPEAFYEGGTAVASAFSIKNGIIGFDIPSYDKTKTLIIDPWRTVLTFPASVNYSAQSNTGYDVCYDNAGNVWVYGGGDPLQLAKYNSAGAIQWTFQIPFNPTYLVGDLEVNKISGSAYVSEGYGAGIVKVNPAGAQSILWPGSVNNYEISRLRLDCNGKLYTTGGGVGPPAGQPTPWQLATIDTNLTTMTGGRVTSSPNGDHDQNLMTLDPSGNFLYTNFNYPAPGSADYINDNEMHKVAIPAVTNTWTQAGPIYGFIELGSIPYVGPYFGMVSRINMFNGMVCGNGFLYTYDGTTLKQWNKATGVMIKQVTTGGKMYFSGGLDLDLCENVYAGISNKINKYDANLNLITTYALADTSCYDLKVDKLKNLIYTTGNGYVAAIAIPAPPPIQLTTSVTPASCTCNGTASANINGGCNNSIFNYIWTGGQTTAAVTGLCPGTYTVIASALVSCNKLIGDTAVVTILGGGALKTDFTVTGTCGNMTFSDTSNVPGATWSWQFPGGNPATSTSQNPGIIVYPQGTYTATVIVSAGGNCADTIYLLCQEHSKINY